MNATKDGERRFAFPPYGCLKDAPRGAVGILAGSGDKRFNRTGKRQRLEETKAWMAASAAMTGCGLGRVVIGPSAGMDIA